MTRHDMTVAVIDPANAADVERLIELLPAGTRGFRVATRADVYRALTRYAAGEGLTPPKPAEPTGLGAVVEDENGDKWVRISTNGSNRWQGPRDNWRFWHQIAAVRVLSEGVQPEPTPDPWASYYDRDLTVEDLVALPVGSVVWDCDDDEATKHANGRWGYGEGAALDAILVRCYGPVRLVSVGGEGK